jgi:hypothetical protein
VLLPDALLDHHFKFSCTDDVSATSNTCVLNDLTSRETHAMGWRGCGVVWFGMTATIFSEENQALNWKSIPKTKDNDLITPYSLATRNSIHAIRALCRVYKSGFSYFIAS